MTQWLSKIYLGRERWHRAIILFTAIFIFSVIIQFAFRWYERGADTQKRLRQSSEEISKLLVYEERWSLTRYRQSFANASSFFVLDKSGLIIDLMDIEGFIPTVVEFKVNLGQMQSGLQTLIVPETGETWRLFVQKIQGGILIIGVRKPEAVTNVDKLLRAHIKLFGPSLETALSVKNSDVDENIEYAVVDDRSLLRSLIGSIPLRVVPSIGLPFNKTIQVQAKDTYIYGVFSLPFYDKLSRMVGTVVSFEKLDPQPWFIFRIWVVNCLSSAALAFFGTLIGIPYIGEKFDPRRLLKHALQNGESQTIEFKESLRWELSPGLQQTAGELKKKASGSEVAVRVIASFLNNRDGGTLVIGIKDDMSIVGLEQDYESLVVKSKTRGDRNKDRDLFQMHVRDVLTKKVSRDISNLYIETAIEEIEGKDVCMVNARPSPVPIYIPISLSDSKTKAFFVRDGASTKPLDVEQTVAYIEKRWPKTIWGRIQNILHL